ncbi:MAG: glycosyltransferase family 4 protein [Candidatus Sungbacteria bacterium]|nr:glycosyltransferase family 4 protein [Candidatus Sungbacteria bacterium]
MKICFLTHNLKQDNGGGVFSAHVVSGIAKAMNADAEILTTEKSGFAGEQAILNFGRIAFFRTFFAARKAFKNCDVIHAFDLFPYGMLAVFAGLGLGKKVIITLIGSGSIIPLYQPAASFFARFALRRAHRLVAISAFTRGEILKKVPGLEIHVIHPGIDLSEYKTILQEPLSDEIKKLQPYILSVGTIRWRKGYKRSIRAFAEVVKKFPDYRYVIVGKKQSEKFFRELQDIIGELNLQGKVIFLETIEMRAELLRWYRGAELFCLFSENINHDVEGFGIVFLEAAACGLPVVGIKNCGVEDAIEDGKNGILIGSRDPKEFAGAIISILGDEEKKQSMGKKSIARAKMFAWGEKNEEYQKLYSHY